MKLSKKLYSLIIILVFFFLVMPFKICQFLILTTLFIILLSLWYAKTLQKNIKAERTITELKLACKEKAEISFTIKNFSSLPAFMVHFVDNAPFFYVYGQENTGLIELRPNEIKKVSYYVSMQDRGRYQIGPITLKTSDPLGLFTVEIELEANINVMVRPPRNKIITHTKPGFPQGHLKIENVCYEDITMRRSLREYQNGDELKRVNWRASAKFGELFTNVYEDSYDAPFFIFLNLAESDYELHDLRYHTEKAIEIAASIVERSRFLHQRVGFASYATDFPFLKPQINQSEAILDILSVIKTQSGKLDYDPRKKFMRDLPSGTLFFTIGPEQVRTYFSKVEASMENINTQNVGICE